MWACDADGYGRRAWRAMQAVSEVCVCVCVCVCMCVCVCVCAYAVRERTTRPPASENLAPRL